MNKIVYFLVAVTLSSLSILTFDSQFCALQAQNRSENAQELVEQDKPQTVQENQEPENQLEQQNINQNQQQERELEQNLNIQQRGIQNRQSPGNTEAFDEAVPISPDREVPLKF